MNKHLKSYHTGSLEPIWKALHGFLQTSCIFMSRAGSSHFRLRICRLFQPSPLPFPAATHGLSKERQISSAEGSCAPTL